MPWFPDFKPCEALVWWLLGTLHSSACESQPDGTRSQAWLEKALIFKLLQISLNQLFPSHYWQQQEQQWLNITKKAELEKRQTFRKKIGPNMDT